jgi:hypothetical protein
LNNQRFNGAGTDMHRPSVRRGGTLLFAAAPMTSATTPDNVIIIILVSVLVTTSGVIYAKRSNGSELRQDAG